MNSQYILRINTNSENHINIASILNIDFFSTQLYCEYSIKESSILYTNAINYFLDLIEVNIDNLIKNDIYIDDLSIWYLYEYDEQCNIEFESSQLKRLGDIGISLCISCWKK